MEEDSEDGFINNEDYYAFLNVSKNATIDEINCAYRNLSRIYHPDKHVDPDNKTDATILFNRTKKAYEVLSDPHQRAIYDSLGVKGLETEGWEIIHRTRTPAEIREEYERLASENEERKLQQRTNPKGNVTINFNATDLFNSYDSFDDSPLPSIEISGMSISQSIDAPISIRDTIILSGNLNAQNGNGSGGFLISGRRLINKGWLEMDIGGGNGPVFGLKGSRNISQKIYTVGGLNLNFRSNDIIPGILSTLAVQLDKYTIGYITYTGGNSQMSMSTVIQRNNDKYHLNASISLGIPHSFISVNFTRKFIEHDLKLKMAGKLGTFGFMFEYGAEKKISKYSSVIASVYLGVPIGVILKIKIIRSSQSYIFPIHLSEEIIPAAIFYATVTPLFTWLVIKKTIIEPMNAAEKQRNITKIKETNRQRMTEKRKEAETAIELMSATVDRIIHEETNKNGLIIIMAKYGSETEISNDDGATDNIAIIDVTKPIQCLVKDSKLILQSNSKSELPGFYDPCVGEKKKLKIEYSFQGKIQTVLIDDMETISLPINKSNSAR